LGLSRRWRDYAGVKKEDDVMETLKELARKYPRFGYRRLHQMLLRRQAKDGPGKRVNVKRVRRICAAAGLKVPTRKRRKRRGLGVKTPVVAEYPNHVWAYDFVHDRCANGRQLRFLTVVDEFTREGLAIEVDHRMNAARIWQVLERLMRERGVPEFVRSDNGPEFIAKCLMRMLAVKNITCAHIEPGSPWQNGRNERFNGIFRDECANMETFHHKDHARALSQLFLKYYNQERPHSSLGYLTPREFARRHPPLGAGSVDSYSNVPSPAPQGGVPHVPGPEPQPRVTVYS
jgi:putative transposase